MGGSTAFARSALTLAGRAVAGTSVGPTTQADASVGPTARVGSGRCTAAGAYASQDAIRSSAAQQARTMAGQRDAHRRTAPSRARAGWRPSQQRGGEHVTRAKVIMSSADCLSADTSCKNGSAKSKCRFCNRFRRFVLQLSQESRSNHSSGHSPVARCLACRQAGRRAQPAGTADAARIRELTHISGWYERTLRKGF